MSGLIVQEWIERSGGAEQVLDAFRIALPDSRVYALWSDDPGRFSATGVSESWMSRTPLRKHKALGLPLMPATWRMAGVAERPDWVLTSSYVFAHHCDFGTRARGVPKFSYVHTPARYLWEPDLDGRGKGAALAPARAALKASDRRAAAHSGDLAANSMFVRRRIIRSWERDARVIYPPVHANRIIAGGRWAERLTAEEQATLAALPERGFLMAASRLVPYKRHDEVVRMGDRLGIPVVVAGTGPERAHLEALAAAASVPVHLLGFVSDEMMRALFQRALAFVFPPVEDFGIVPVEAMAAGCPVIVNRTGGAAESVIDGVTGFHVDPDDPFEVRAAVERVESLSSAAAQARAAEFDIENFIARVREWIGAGVTARDRTASGLNERVPAAA
ncbi:glycosyltransferase [Microbacterium hominis]|uniref:D-inositol 3-phosphate glycosyltransferase n=1 Tax=Microbacterium hominis TaxID=162426 RepID=A0A7D4UGX5_9MICO|nr:glycosyltransferase [Microbacterium hominis]QKJ20289.1 glycosyltransferase [Microbacterium hominis]